MKFLRSKEPPVYLLAGRIRPGRDEVAERAFSAVLGAGAALMDARKSGGIQTEHVDQMYAVVRDAEEHCNDDLRKTLRSYLFVLIGFSGGVVGEGPVIDRRRLFVEAWRQASGIDTDTQAVG